MAGDPVKPDGLADAAWRKQNGVTGPAALYDAGAPQAAPQKPAAQTEAKESAADQAKRAPTELKAEHTPKDGMNARPTEATPATPGGMFQTGRQAFFNRWHEQRQAAAAGQDGTPPAKADAPAAKPLAPLVERLRAAQPAEKLAQAEAHAAAAKRAAERLASRMGMDGHSAG